MAKATVEALMAYMEARIADRRKVILSGTLPTIEDYRAACAEVVDLERTVSHGRGLLEQDRNHEDEDQ